MTSGNLLTLINLIIAVHAKGTVLIFMPVNNNVDSIMSTCSGIQLIWIAKTMLNASLSACYEIRHNLTVSVFLFIIANTWYDTCYYHNNIFLPRSTNPTRCQVQFANNQRRRNRKVTCPRGTRHKTLELTEQHR